MCGQGQGSWAADAPTRRNRAPRVRVLPGFKKNPNHQIWPFKLLTGPRGSGKRYGRCSGSLRVVDAVPTGSLVWVTLSGVGGGGCRRLQCHAQLRRALLPPKRLGVRVYPGHAVDHEQGARHHRVAEAPWHGRPTRRGDEYPQERECGGGDLATGRVSACVVACGSLSTGSTPTTSLVRGQTLAAHRHQLEKIPQRREYTKDRYGIQPCCGPGL